MILYCNSNVWQQSTVPLLSKVIAEPNISNSTKYGKQGKRKPQSVIDKV
jgi:hypothetical protein